MTTVLPQRNLDVLRSIAVLAVLVSHTAQYWLSIERAPFLGHLAHMGVLLFFVHTSLVLMGSLERSERADLHGSRLAFDFYVRRAFRIYPLAILAVLIVVLLGLPRMPDEIAVTPTPLVLAANLALAQNLVVAAPSILGPLWSLPVELQMYVVLPFCYWAVKRGSPRMILGLVAIAAGLGLAQGWATAAHLQGAWRLSMLAYAPCFMAGVWAYARLRSAPAPRMPSSLWLPLLWGALLTAPLLVPMTQRSPWTGWPLALAIGALIPMVRDLSESALTRLAHWIATYSYGIYLFHIPFLILLVGPHRSEAPPVWRVATAVLATIAFSVLCYHTIEHPMIRWGSAVSRGTGRVPVRV